jgi:hypothetical protein
VARVYTSAFEVRRKITRVSSIELLHSDSIFIVVL